MNCQIIANIITVLSIVFLVLLICRENYIPNYNYYKHSKYQNDSSTDGLIGLIYPPRAGPLHTNTEFPYKNETCSHGFTAIYEQDPYLKVYNKQSNMC